MLSGNARSKIYDAHPSGAGDLWSTLERVDLFEFATEP